MIDRPRLEIPLRLAMRGTGMAWRIASFVIVAVIVAACASTSSESEPGRAVMSSHKGWAIRVTPSFSHRSNRWRARTVVWPPDRNYQTQPGIMLRFSETASDQNAVVQAALQAARQYIEASQTEHQ